ncbi:hypothetical protein BGW80DRAFT_1318599 [Lactifluus volemus]|nr:hypothetical protein BGW80DRAFT_1318599 [Lactifluus volemus]
MDSSVAREPVNQDEEKGTVVKDHRDGDDPSLKMSRWTLCISQTDKIDTEMAEGWKADMDGILLYTGIFSATVAAFLVESYKLLKPDPGEISARIHLQATKQLAAISNGTRLRADYVTRRTDRLGVTRKSRSSP